jgi:outer membrane biosynthesis protein TonB
MNKKLGQYLLISCALHGAIMLLLYLISGSAVIPTNFLVLGAHSKEHLETLYKPMGHVVPFVPIHMRPQPNPTPTDQTSQPKEPEIEEKSPQQNKTTLEQDKKKPLVPQNKLPKIAKSEERKLRKQKPAIDSNELTPPTPTLIRRTSSKTNGVAVKGADKQNTTLAANPLLIEPQRVPNGQGNTHLFTEHIQKEISRLWRPPVGVPKGTECTVKFTVTKKGKVYHFDFLKRSEIVIYDLSVTRIAHKFNFDKPLWGKTFTIDFRQ